jgi:hypothetical protein
VTKQPERKSDRPYKGAFVDFIKSKQWHWFITIPIGLCDKDDVVLKRLQAIEASLCAKYLVNRYHELPEEARFSMAIGFEGERTLGTRHAHIVAYVPPPIKKHVSHAMLIGLFPSEFRFLWNKMRLLSAPDFEEAWIEYPWEDITFGRVNVARSIYPAKDVRQHEVSWSRFEFVTPPKFRTFKNENLGVRHNKDRQRRAVLGLS